MQFLYPYPLFEAIGEAGVATPGDPLAVGQPAGALGLEVQQALRERFSVVKNRRRLARG